MNIENIRNMYLNKIINHINKVNDELNLYNYTYINQFAGAQANIELPVHNSNVFNNIMILKGKIEEHKSKIAEHENIINKIKVEHQEKLREKQVEHENIIKKNKFDHQEMLETKLIEHDKNIRDLNKRYSEEIAKNKDAIQKLTLINDQMKIEINNAKSKQTEAEEISNQLTRTNKELVLDNQKLIAEVKEINNKSIETLFNLTKKIIQTNSLLFNNTQTNILKVSKEIEQINNRYELDNSIKEIIVSGNRFYTDVNATIESINKNDSIERVNDQLNEITTKSREINNQATKKYNQLIAEQNKLIAEYTENL